MPEAPRSVAASLPEALALPLRGDGRAILLGGTFLLSMASGLLSQPYLCCIVIPYMYAYTVRVVHAAADGESEAPQWPDFTFWETKDSYAQAFLVSVAGGLPLFLCFLLWANFPAAAIGCALLTVAFLPMSWLAVCLLNSVEALRPAFLLRSIAAAPRDYFALSGLLALTWVVDAIVFALLERLPYGGLTLASGFWFYTSIVMASLLGSFYRLNREALDWGID